MGKTVVALYEGPQVARQAIKDLKEARFTPAEIRQVNTTDFEETKPRETDVLGVSGLAKPEVGEYEEAVRRGCSLVAVTSKSPEIVKAQEVLSRHHPIDLDLKVAQWRTSGWKNPYDAVRDQNPKRAIEDARVQTGRDQSSTSVRVFAW